MYKRQAWTRGGGICGCTTTDSAYVKGELITRPDLRTEKQPSVNINQLGAAIKDESVKTLYVYASNPANSVSDTKAVIEGLSREDLLTVVHERFMTDTARYADIILPAHTATAPLPRHGRLLSLPAKAKATGTHSDFWPKKWDMTTSISS